MRLFCGTASFFCGWGKGDKCYGCYNTYSTYNTYFNFEGERNAKNTFLGNFLKLEIDKPGRLSVCNQKKPCGGNQPYDIYVIEMHAYRLISRQYVLASGLHNQSVDKDHQDEQQNRRKRAQKVDI